uniref:Replication protein A 70 kDa DNA-binding subunit B/D first OB fold domain-containing protein n=1 Tax=Lactuca sativa TaxID=4236 RepID=A0A9R1WQ72_LACSA|nr:hypothetical protein LSAT_V11C100042260 [Lactuca sativa]
MPGSKKEVGEVIGSSGTKERRKESNFEATRRVHTKVHEAIRKVLAVYRFHKGDSASRLTENTNVTMISDLALAQDEYTIKVRIIRLWKQIRMIGMILLDERGAKIECNVDKPLASLQGKTLEEYGDYYIQKPTIGLNNGAIKFVDDIIGNVFQCFPLEPLKDKQEQKITLKLEDLEGHEGRYADEIVAYVSKHHGHFVMIIQLVKFKNVRQRPYVNNTYLSTKLFIDDNIKEIIAFKKSLQARKNSSCSSISHASGSSIMYSLHDDFVQNNTFYKISVVHELNEMFEDIQNWYYNACTKCKSNVKIIDVPNETLNGLGQLKRKR